MREREREKKVSTSFIYLFRKVKSYNQNLIEVKFIFKTLFVVFVATADCNETKR